MGCANGVRIPDIGCPHAHHSFSDTERSLHRARQLLVGESRSLKLLWADALRRLAAEKTKSEQSWLPPQWHHVNFLSAQTMIVGTTDNQRVGLILDPDTTTEFALSFAPEDARELARQLIAEADKLPQSSTPKMN